MVRRVGIGLASAALLAALVYPAVAPGELDSLPLSNSPMFAHERSAVTRFSVAVWLDETGEERRLDLRLVGGTDQPVQAATTVRQAIRAQQSDVLCREIAEQLDEPGTDQGAATTVAGRADLSAFDGVYSYGPPTPSERFADPQFQEDCATPWNTLNPDATTQDPAVVPEGEPNHTVGLLQACRALTIFAAAAEAAGPNLNNETFAAGLAGIGEFTLPGTNAASLGAGKYDAEDDLRLSTYNPDAADDESNFIEFTG